MKLDFPNMPETAAPNFKGGEGVTHIRMYDDGMNRIVLCRLSKGSSIGLHTHETNSETIYILSGEAKIITDGQEETYIPGQCHHCPKGHAHTTIAVSDEDLLLLGVIPEQ